MSSRLQQSQVSAFRLSRHHLLGHSQADLATVCGDVCGIQAQLMRAAELQLWARIPDLVQAEIYSQLWTSRTLVKTSLMRQTLHIVPTAEFALFIAALKSSRSTAIRRGMRKYAGVSQDEIEALNRLIMKALRDGPMRQDQLTDVIRPKLGTNVKNYMKLAWSIQLFRPALVEGLICYGPRDGTKDTFVRVDQWLPEPREYDGEEAQQLLLRRYLRAYGPATPRDFSRWAGIPTREVKQVWAPLQRELLEISVDGKKGFILKRDHKQIKQGGFGEQVVRLLPRFDPYMLGHADKDHLVDPTGYKQVYRSQGWISPVVLFNGRAIGVWSHTARSKRVDLQIYPFENLPRGLRGRIEKEAERLGTFLKVSAKLEFRRGNK